MRKTVIVIGVAVVLLLAFFLYEAKIAEDNLRLIETSSYLIRECESKINEKKYEEALQTLNIMLKDNKNNFVAHSLKGSLLLLANRPREAIESYKQALKLKDIPGYHKNLAKAYFKNVEYAFSVDEFSKYLKTVKDDEESLFFRARAYSIMELYREAMLDADTILALKKIDYNSAMLKAEICFGIGNYVQSQEYYYKALKLIENLPKESRDYYYIEVYSSIGSIYIKNREFEKAFSAFKKAEQINGDKIYLYSDIVRLKILLGEYDEAKYYVDRLKKEYPLAIQEYEELSGYYFIALYEIDEAAKIYSVLIDSEDSEYFLLAEHYYNLISLLFENNRLAEIDQYAERVYSIFSGNVKQKGYYSLKYNIARALCFSKKHRQKGLKIARQAYKENGEKKYLYDIGECYYIAEDYDKAIELFEMFLREDKYLEEAYIYLARAYSKVGKTVKAMEIIEMGIKINPKNNWLLKTKKNLETSTK